MSFLLETLQTPGSYLPAPKAGGTRATAGIGLRAVCQTLERMKVHFKEKSNFAFPVTHNCQTLKRMSVYKDIEKRKKEKLYLPTIAVAIVRGTAQRLSNCSSLEKV